MLFMKFAIFALLTLWFASGQPVSAQSAESPRATPSKQVPPAVLFAQRYVRALRDSGAVGVIPLTAPKARAPKDYASNMDALRDELSPKQTTVTLDRWSSVPAKGDAPPLSLVTFKIEDIARPMELTLYVEELDGRLLLNTIMTRALATKEH